MGDRDRLMACKVRERERQGDREREIKRMREWERETKGMRE